MGRKWFIAEIVYWLFVIVIAVIMLILGIVYALVKMLITEVILHAIYMFDYLSNIYVFGFPIFEYLFVLFIIFLLVSCIAFIMLVIDEDTAWKYREK